MTASIDPTTAIPSLYRPLDEHGLRLLEICPSEDSDSQIQVKMFPRLFEDVRGQFIPFSYVWGDAADTETITINGVSRNITRNLARLIRQTRALLPDILARISWEKPALFWADAICINQGDIEERNRQVQLMGSIYGSAPTVIAWLGQAEDSHLAASVIDATAAWLKACMEKNPDVDEIERQDPNCGGWMERYPAFWSFSGDIVKSNPYWGALYTLFQSPYWKRTWTFQEMVLPADVLFISGSALISFDSLIILMLWVVAFLGGAESDFSFLDQETYPHLRIAVRNTQDAITFSILSPFDIREQLASPQRPTLALVSALGALQASDPRDKIFGLLGVVDTQFVADYNKPALQIYCEFVSAWMREVQDLNFLFQANHMYHTEGSTGQPGLPSWAPNWGAIAWALSADVDVSSTFPIGHKLLSRRLKASARLITDPAHMSQSSRILTATGVVCDEVEEVYPTWKHSPGVMAVGASFFNLVQRHTDRSRLGSPGEAGSGCFSRHIFQILFRTALEDTSLFENQVHLLQCDSSNFHAWAISFLSWLAICHRHDIGQDPSTRDFHGTARTFLPLLGIPPGPDFSRFWREEIFGDVKLDEPEEPDVARWPDAAAALQWSWENCRAELNSVQLQSLYGLAHCPKFLTKKNYMGVASSVEVGDKVVVLAGCDAPVLLRPKDGHYEHIGVCFVVGLMDGEARDMVD